ncbi:MAG: hypothetical protein V2A58_16195 [Planctomycetota bacterium]
MAKSKENKAKLERDRKVLDVTFNSAGPSVNGAWGWKIPRNPARVMGKFTDAECEVSNLAKSKTPQKREASRVKTYTYWAPFNYSNVKVELGRPGTGVEFNIDGAELDIYPYGSITVKETQPIVAVTVIGSGCSNQAYVWLEAEPVEWKYPRTGVRMPKRDLWGMHIRYDAWQSTDESWNDAGLSCARFDIPESRRVIVGGGSMGADPHYCVRIIRLDVKEPLA